MMVINNGSVIAAAIITAVLLLSMGGGQESGDDGDTGFFGSLFIRTEKEPVVIETSCEEELLMKNYDNESAIQLCKLRKRNE